MAENIVLETKSLRKSYGSLTAVKNLSLQVLAGEIFGFLGPNGAGKTTSIHMICGLLKPDSGEVLIHGKLARSGETALRSRVGMCPQEIVLWERLTCLEQLVFIGQMYGVKETEARSRGKKLLEELGLVEKASAQARTLSGGMQRRLNLAMALVHDPDIVVLDEPEAGLDPQSRVKVREYIQSLARRKTVILTTHNMDEADRLADRVAIIDHGELLVLDTPEQLKQQLGRGDVVEMTLSGDLSGSVQERVRAALGGNGHQILWDGEQKLLSIRELNAVAALPVFLSGLTTAGLIPSEVRLRENSLEDVFIQLTGRRLRE